LLAASAPAGSSYIAYDALVRDADAVMGTLAATLPLTLPAGGLEGTVKPALRHHELRDHPVLGSALSESADLEEAIAREYPDEALAAEFARCLVERGERLTSVGEAHTAALQTLRQRDRDIEDLSTLHREALATIEERDAQIEELDRRLAETGAHLGLALDRLRERDEQIKRVMAIPVVGHLLRLARWMHARR
jgi:hypothetical protein